MKYTIYLLSSIILVSLIPNAKACISMPRSVALENSPYFFKNFSIHGGYFAFKMSEGNQDVKLSCDKTNGINQWHVEALDDRSTSVVDSIPRMPLGEKMVDASGNLVAMAIIDSVEIPNVTRMEPFISGTEEASVDVRSRNSNNFMTIKCIHQERSGNLGLGSRTMIVEFKDSSGNIVSTVGAQETLGIRGLNPNAPDATIDMVNLSPSHMNIPGCGGGNHMINQGNSQKVNN